MHINKIQILLLQIDHSIQVRMSDSVSCHALE